AGAIYGPGGSVREWYFVKRVLDGRRYVLLGNRGEGRFHPVATDNLAELIWLAVERPGRRVLNAGDPGPPTLLEISRAIAAALDHEWTEVLLSTLDEPCETPWTGPKPVVLDMSEAAFEVGYQPVTTYERAVPATRDPSGPGSRPATRCRAGWPASACRSRSRSVRSDRPPPAPCSRRPRAHRPCRLRTALVAPRNCSPRTARRRRRLRGARDSATPRAGASCARERRPSRRGCSRRGTSGCRRGRGSA